MTMIDASVKKRAIKNICIDGILFILGSAIFAMSVNIFTAPNDIAAGGLTGVATMLNYLFNIPIGMSIIIMNIPLFIWGFISMGYRFLIKTVVATVLSSLMIDLTAGIMPRYTENIFLTIVVGGFLAGIGLSMIFVRGGTTGGTDLAASLINRQLRHLSFGRLLLIIDFAIVVMSAFVYGNIESPFYALVVIYITTKVIDMVLYGTDIGVGKMMFIISSKNDIIADKIIKDMDRGVTALKSRGCYSGINGEVLLCAVRRQEVYRIYDIINQIDDRAFVVVSEAGEIRGEGFKEHAHTNIKGK